MTPDQKTATLTTIFSEVLADLAFMFNDDVDEAPTPVAGDVWLEAEISYHGPQRGTLRFRCPRLFSEQLAANLLGIDIDSTEASDQSADAVKEFMNIVCGQLITAIHGTEAVFDLTIPTLRELSETPSMPDEQDANSSTLVVEEQRLHLAYFPG